MEMDISVFYTRAILQSTAQTLDQLVLPAHIQLAPGRPNLPNILQDVVAHTARRKNSRLSGVVIGCCGPAGLRESVRRAEATISGKQRDSVGGLEFVAE